MQRPVHYYSTNTVESDHQVVRITRPFLELTIRTRRRPNGPDLPRPCVPVSGSRARLTLQRRPQIQDRSIQELKLKVRTPAWGTLASHSIPSHYIANSPHPHPSEPESATRRPEWSKLTPDPLPPWHRCTSSTRSFAPPMRGTFEQALLSNLLRGRLIRRRRRHRRCHRRRHCRRHSAPPFPPVNARSTCPPWLSSPCFHFGIVAAITALTPATAAALLVAVAAPSFSSAPFRKDRTRRCKPTCRQSSNRYDGAEAAARRDTAAAPFPAERHTHHVKRHRRGPPFYFFFFYGAIITIDSPASSYVML